MSTKKLRWRPLWLGILITLGLLLVTPIAAIIFLRSEAGSQFLIGKLKEVLAESQIGAQPNRMEFAEGRIDPFSGFQFKDFVLVREQEGLKLEFTSGLIEVEYRLSLLSRRIEVKKVYLERPSLILRLETAEKNVESAESNQSSTSLDEFILDPVARVLIHEVLLKGLYARIELINGGQKSSIEIKEADLKFGFEAVPKRLATNGSFQSEQAVKVISDDVSLDAKVAAQWEMSVARVGDRWEYRLKPFELDVLASNAGFRAKSSPLNASLSELALKLNAGLLAHSDQLLALDGNSVESVDVDGQGSARNLQLDDGNKKTAKQIQNQKFELSVRLKDRIEVSVRHILNGVSLPEALTRSVDAKLETQAQVDRKLTQADVKVSAEFANARLLDLSSRIHLKEEKLELTGRADLEVKPELSRYFRSTESLKTLGPFLLKTEFSLHSPAKEVLKAELRANAPVMKPSLLNERLSFELKSGAIWNRVQNRFELESDLRIQALDQNANLRLTSRATGNLQTKDAQAQLELNAETAERKVNVGRFGGKVHVPASLSVYGGRGVTLSGELDLREVKFATSAWDVQGVSGRIPFSEKLVLNGNKISFEHLLRLNPFERADFDRVRPLLSGNVPVRIEKMRWEDRTFGPFIGFFSIRQNRISAHQFNLDVGTGRVYGEMFFDLHPSELQFGILSRLSALHIGEIFPKRFLKRLPADTGRVGGRTGLIINLNRSSIDGRLDVTEIGGPQLIAMVNLLDPDFDDEKMNKVRKLLEHGYPTSVGLSFGKGYMDMDIALSVLGVEVRESVREIPVSPLLSAATVDLVQQVKKGPIE